ncbi:alk-exo [Matsumuraeses phaseoli granulovirus]|uniref:Alk-exo n=1 Tax=Matsumuraeses phaseoli granulovirus TaxID=2760664 RepID=A0AAE7SYT7_9BBAC|nr:alk-exo [Matsumuraeses phaseoli granulovirus]QOD40077.1 alk-exo [Matsumuraeses phaseoli granulovirus]
MAYEMAILENKLTDEQMKLAKQYCLQNFVKNLTLNARLAKNDIYKLEMATRGQAENLLWKLLRINRITASRSSGVGFCGDDMPAIIYGKKHEKLLKENHLLMSIVRDSIEDKLKKKIVEEVLECGLFLSEIGLYSASPDAYFKLDSGELVVMEIKCPYTYRNETLQGLRTKMNNTRNRYRVAHTAFSVNRNNDMHVIVEKRNDHYRQMQAQLYVTGGVMAVYVVKFSDMPEIHFVNRDEKLIKEMRDRELYKLGVYVNENKKNRVMVMEKERLDSFINMQLSEGMSAKELIKEGLYHYCGQIICYFCNQHFEIIDKTIAEIRLEHNNTCDKKDNISMIKVAHGKYINIKDRINNLNATLKFDSTECQRLAKDGYFYDGSKIVLYCCGGSDSHRSGCRKASTN